MEVDTVLYLLGSPIVLVLWAGALKFCAALVLGKGEETRIEK